MIYFKSFFIHSCFYVTHQNNDGRMVAKGTGQTYDIECGMVFIIQLFPFMFIYFLRKRKIWSEKNLDKKIISLLIFPGLDVPKRLPP